MRIQIVLLFAIAAAFFMTWNRARERVIRSGEAVLWSGIWIAAALVVLSPSVASRLADVVGVGRGADLVVYVSIIALFALSFRSFVNHVRIERQITELVRRDALRGLPKK